MGVDERIELAWRARPARGELACGDVVVVAPAGEDILVALIDGLGHGPEAARAAEAAGEFLRANSKRPLEPLFEACSAAIATTRGVAMAVLRIVNEPFVLEHAGVGNVALRVITREPVNAVPYPGVVGKRMRKVRATRSTLHSNDLLVLHSDGISSRMRLDQLRAESAEGSVEAIMLAHAKSHDDASCVVIECR